LLTFCPGMPASTNPLVRTARGVVTVARRRGIGYFAYLLGGVAWPRVAYRFGWGPAAPPVMQGVFAAAGEITAHKPDVRELRELELIADEGQTVSPVADASPDEIERLMDRAHAAGITGLSKSFNDVVRAPDGSLRFSDLAYARKHRPGTVPFVSARDADRRDFNRVFNASLLTEATARQLLENLKATVPEGYRKYAPIDFGCGLTVGQIASTDSGTGRWEFFNRHVVAPLIAGKRVLDLGANNGSLPLMMARAGAREVVAIEFTPAIAEFARLNARILAWRDMRRYDIEILTGDMRLFLSQDLGRFDIITAFCSLYYLPEEDMARIINKAAAMNAVLILQANEAIENNLPGRTLDLHRLMRDNGYPEITLHTPAGLARPLLVGYTTLAAALPQV
jgi:2-polyprenyl-3-methyl-5-hydroxy-6-metoxy-1,4-benzoquinol methylase